MEVRNACHPADFKHYTTERLREDFLIQGLFVPDEVKMVYSHIDRIITGGVVPVNPVSLVAGSELRAEYFLERREIGIINIGGEGKVVADGVEYVLGSKDGLYIGKGTKQVTFESADAANPAKFYFNSTPAHMTYPTVKIGFSEAEEEKLGSLEQSNARTIHRYIHLKGVRSCQLVMGMTELEPGSVWNTMPCHTHERRMEVYLYFNIPETAVTFHFMGEPTETRHIVVRNEEAVISPSWSIHSGCGTRNYTFIWGMAGENQVFADMDAVPMSTLK
jgi:4-deoxy-L-threo-5-hexosulose-uronate ketol-isomerase